MNRAVRATSQLILLLAVLDVSASRVVAQQPAPEPFGDVKISWAVVDNIQSAGFRFILTLENQGRRPLPRSGWELYFNMMRMVDTVRVPPSIRLRHINGDFYRLSPTEAFRVLSPGQRVALPLSADAWAIKTGDAPRGFYFVVDGVPIPLGEVHFAPFEHQAQTKRSPADQLPVPTAASRYRDNSVLSLLSSDLVGRILPTPVSFEERSGNLTLGAGVTIAHQSGLQREARYLQTSLEAVMGTRPRVVQGLPSSDARREPNSIRLRTDQAIASEGYTLTIDPLGGVDVNGGDAAGVFYGIQSLRALLPLEVYATPAQRIELPAWVVEDRPGLRHRGMHLDVARNFQPVESVKKLLDVMSMYKLNRFHLHLTDDEGWRLAIAGLPELTAVGGRRGHTLDEQDHLFPSFGSGPYPEVPPGSGHYTREQYVDLLRYAAERHIQVIPEIDLPGHARAAIVGMESRYRRLSQEGREDRAREFRLRDPQDRSTYRSVQRFNDNVINVCLESSYLFIETVVDELVAMHVEANDLLELVHIGGDEVPVGVWQQSPECRALIDRSPELSQVPQLFDYFLRRTADILEARGLALAGWEEIGLADRFHVPGPKQPSAEFVQRGFVPFVWNAVWGWGAEDLGYRMANAGYQVVLSNAGNLYLDLAYDKDPAEPGLYWAGFIDTRTAWEFLPFNLFRTARRDIMGNHIDESRYADRARPTAEGRKNIRGIQGQLWSETLVEPSRLEYMAFPRVLALAERAWAPEPEWSLIADLAQRERTLLASWNEFANRLGQRELKRLDYLHGGIDYRLPVAGAMVEEGVLTANVSYPGLSIRYTTDGSVPSAQSPRYHAPVQVEGQVSLRVFDTRGRGGRAIIVSR